MKPAVICCCEVGTAMSPMTREEMSDMVQAMREAWEGAATKRPAISAIFKDDAPYLTIWDNNLCKCTHERILENVYTVRGHRRTAQAFLCTMPGDTDEEGIDVVNVHAPSGKPRLIDAQRFELIQNLLQSSSRTKANRPIGEGRFLIGGDMNTCEITLSQILEKLQSQKILKTTVGMMYPLDAKHGDMCVVGGFTATLVRERACNHDSQHVPYGIVWRKPPPLQTTPPPPQTTTPPPQTQIPTTSDTQTESRAPFPTEVEATRHATEQSHQQSQIPTTPDDPKHVPYSIVWRKPAPLQTTPPPPQTTTPPPQTQIPTTSDTQTESRAPFPTEVEATRHATEQSHQQSQIPTTPDTGMLQSCRTLTRGHSPGPQESRATEATVPTEVATTRHATELSHPHEHEMPELNGPEQGMAYIIVNAFLDNVTFESTEAERLIKEIILRTREVIPPHMLGHIDEVFRPIFFYYPNGLSDRTLSEPRNASQYIIRWREIAEWRQIENASVTQHATEQLAKHQLDKIFHEYVRDFIENEANDTQRSQSWTKNKSRAEAVLRNRCGSVLMAKAIWQVGLPQVLFATEQQQHSIATDTETILIWLSKLANSIQEHKATTAYQEHARKSGTEKNKSGLTEAELNLKEAKKRAQRIKYAPQPSTASGGNRWHAPAQWRGHDDTWQARTQWQGWYGDTWQEHRQWQ